MQDGSSRSEAFPFCFVNHGPVHPSCVRDPVEMLVWFQRDVAVDERKPLLKGCPVALRRKVFWGKSFVYFLNDSYCYDREVVEGYAKDLGRTIAGKFEDALASNADFESLDEDGVEGMAEKYLADLDQGMLEALPPFLAALEAWTAKAHATIPIAFLVGPHTPKVEDDWGIWSRENLFHLASGLFADDGGIHPEGTQSAGGAATMLARIYLLIAKNGNRKTAHQDALDQFAGKIDLVFESFPERENGTTLLSQLLCRLSPAERVERVTRLKPSTQLAYFASREANQTPTRDFTTIAEPLAYLARLIEQIPVERTRETHADLARMACALVPQPSSSGGKRDWTHAKLATALFEQVIAARPDVEDYIHCASTYEGCSDFESMLRISHLGLERWPGNDELSHLLEVAARQCGRQDLLSGLAIDPNRIANESCRLISQGRTDEARELLVGHLSQDVPVSRAVLTNFLAILPTCPPLPAQLVEKVFTLSRQSLLERDDTHHQPLVENLLSNLIERQRFEQSIAAVRDYQASGGQLTVPLAIAYTHAAQMTGDRKTVYLVLKEASAFHHALPSGSTKGKENYHLLLWNLAALCAFLKMRERMLAYLREAKPIFADFTSLKTNEDFKAYETDVDFLALFD